MVLVEAGPWTDTETRLRTLQERLYGCMDAAIDGQLADQFPASRGKEVIIQVDFYDVPRAQAEDFMERFAFGIKFLPDYNPAGSPYVAGFRFEATYGTS